MQHVPPGSAARSSPFAAFPAFLFISSSAFIRVHRRLFAFAFLAAFLSIF
jgi:hypothetical protein